MSEMIVWGVGTPRTLRVHRTLTELGMKYSTRPIQSRTGETLTDEYTVLNQRQKIPVLQDGDVTLTESAAITTYLADRYGNPEVPLVPADTIHRAHCFEWCYFSLSELDATSLYVLRRHEGLPQIYGEAPAANAAARLYFQKQMRSVDHALQDGRTFIVAQQFSIADIMLCSCLTWAQAVDIPIAAHVAAYNQRIMARPAYQAAVLANRIPRT